MRQNDHVPLLRFLCLNSGQRDWLQQLHHVKKIKNKKKKPGLRSKSFLSKAQGVSFAFSDKETGRHPAPGGPAGPSDDGSPPQCLRGLEKLGVRQSQRRQQNRPEELRRHPSAGEVAPQDHWPGDPGAGHRWEPCSPARRTHARCPVLRPGGRCTSRVLGLGSGPTWGRRHGQVQGVFANDESRKGTARATPTEWPH